MARAGKWLMAQNSRLRQQLLVPTSVLLSALAALGWPREAASHNPVTTTVTFNQDIAPLLERKCLQCHVDNGLAMPLTSWDQARPWAVAIKEEVLARRMPPWSAEHGYGAFTNDVGLTAREFDFLLSWIDGGVPRGDGDEPSHMDHSGHWMLGEPDAVAASPGGVTVEANRPAGFMRLLVDSGVDEDVWLRAVDYKPGDQRVAHAAFFSVVETGEYLGGWTPWTPTMELPDGLAFRLPAGSQIAVDVLDRGIGETIVDRPSLGLYFADSAPSMPVTNIVLEAADVSGAPVGRAAGRARARAEVVVPAETRLLSLRPDLEEEGASVEVKVRRPDGSIQILLWIRSFAPDWQTPYEFREPVVVPPGSSIIATAAFVTPPQRSRTPRFAVTLTAHQAR